MKDFYYLWCRRRDLNMQPDHYEWPALPLELRRHMNFYIHHKPIHLFFQQRKDVSIDTPSIFQFFLLSLHNLIK